MITVAPELADVLRRLDVAERILDDALKQIRDLKADRSRHERQIARLASLPPR
jgi:hypothetical protein